MGLRRPLIPMHLFKNKDFVIVNILSAVGGVVYYSANSMSEPSRFKIYRSSNTVRHYSRI